jgi:hypothetical protein
MGYTALRRISEAIGWTYDPDPMPDGPLQLTEEQFAAAVALLADVGFATERTPEEAWPHFRGWRVNYETLAYRWADRLLAPPAPWSGTRRGLREQNVTPRRPPHRSPDKPAFYVRPELDL